MWTAPSRPHLQIALCGGSSLADRALATPTIKISDTSWLCLSCLSRHCPARRLRHHYAYLFRFGGEGLLAYNGRTTIATLPVSQSPGQGYLYLVDRRSDHLLRRTQRIPDQLRRASNFTTTRAQTRYQPEEFQEWLRTGHPRIVQQQLPQKTTLEVSYVGNHAMHIAALEDSNQAGLHSN